MTDGTIITMTICGLIILAGGASVGAKAIGCYIEIQACHKRAAIERETFRLKYAESPEAVANQRFEYLIELIEGK